MPSNFSSSLSALISVFVELVVVLVERRQEK
jgi:hypothetical protein